MECKVWSVKCVWSLEWGVESVECKVWSMKSEVWSVKFECRV